MNAFSGILTIDGITIRPAMPDDLSYLKSLIQHIGIEDSDSWLRHKITPLPVEIKGIDLYPNPVMLGSVSWWIVAMSRPFTPISTPFGLVPTINHALYSPFLIGVRREVILPDSGHSIVVVAVNNSGQHVGGIVATVSTSGVLQIAGAEGEVQTLRIMMQAIRSQVLSSSSKIMFVPPTMSQESLAALGLCRVLTDGTPMLVTNHTVAFCCGKQAINLDRFKAMLTGLSESVGCDTLAAKLRNLLDQAKTITLESVNTPNP